MKVGLEGTSGGHVGQPPAQGRIIQTIPTKCVSNLNLKTSKDGVPTASLDSLFQCLIVLMLRKFSPISSLYFPYCSLKLVLLVMPPAATENGPAAGSS